MGLPRGSPRGSPGEPLKHPPPPRTMLRMIAYKTPNGLGTPVKRSRVLPVKILKPKSPVAGSHTDKWFWGNPWGPLVIFLGISNANGEPLRICVGILICFCIHGKKLSCFLIDIVQLSL